MWVRWKTSNWGARNINYLSRKKLWDPWDVFTRHKFVARMYLGVGVGDIESLKSDFPNVNFEADARLAACLFIPKLATKLKFVFLCFVYFCDLSSRRSSGSMSRRLESKVQSKQISQSCRTFARSWRWWSAGSDAGWNSACRAWLRGRNRGSRVAARSARSPCRGRRRGNWKAFIIIQKHSLNFISITRNERWPSWRRSVWSSLFSTAWRTAVRSYADEVVQRLWPRRVKLRTTGPSESRSRRFSPPDQWCCSTPCDEACPAWARSWGSGSTADSLRHSQCSDSSAGLDGTQAPHGDQPRRERTRSSARRSPMLTFRTAKPFRTCTTPTWSECCPATMI